jgi:hypothetical protein
MRLVQLKPATYAGERWWTSQSCVCCATSILSIAWPKRPSRAMEK